MALPLLFDIIESPGHPDLAPLARRLGLERLVFSSQRKALAALKAREPAVIAADFFYGFGNNYAGANVSNLDVLLRSQQRFAPTARVVVFVEAPQRAHVAALAALFPLHAVISLPVDEAELEAAFI